MINQNGQIGLNWRKTKPAVLKGTVTAAAVAETDDEKTWTESQTLVYILKNVLGENERPKQGAVSHWYIYNMAGTLKKENLFSSPWTNDHGHLERLLFIQMGWKVSENKHFCLEIKNKTSVIYSSLTLSSGLAEAPKGRNFSLVLNEENSSSLC